MSVFFCHGRACGVVEIMDARGLEAMAKECKSIYVFDVNSVTCKDQLLTNPASFASS